MNLFIGSSTEAEEYLDWIALRIEDAGHKALRWNAIDDFLFRPGQYTLTSLLDISKKVDAALLIFSSDDRTWFRGDQLMYPRDNVILEYGIFVSRLGLNKAAICRVGGSKIPSDLSGLQIIDIDINKKEHARQVLKNWLNHSENGIVNYNDDKSEFTWKDVERGVAKIVDEMKADGFKPDMVLGIGRSGGILGGLIAGYCGAIPFRAMNWNMKDQEMGNTTVRQHYYDQECLLEYNYKKILLVLGATTNGERPNKALDFFEEKFPNKNFQFAVLVRTHTSVGRISYCAYEVSKIKVLPWHVDSWPTFLEHNIKKD
jgi:hypoxanthine phosphoribosyltransferase